ncbi:GFA family protein [Telluria aromaticivorans]|uniref:GFA family protein n=1 Tax=Telluria aromaticivorans TaxID=2725995 RepID=A0A7Y2NYY9_9BURK|nr:GFA family protein [Telluria aromaticivorans]NNG22479.1 GFA family protein [Telluria aromaticivorans]
MAARLAHWPCATCASSPLPGPKENSHGALFYAAAVFPSDAVTVEGVPREYAGRFFCPRCGSSLFARSEDEVEVHLGALDEPSQLAPTYECWVIRREAWLPPFPLARQYERNRASTNRSEE